nr:putative porin [Xanthovirga aplysinae]
MVYGPTTTQYFYENSIKYNLEALHTIDTLLDNMEKFGFKEVNDGRYQDLGNLGSAIRPLYFSSPKNIGLSSGYDAFKPYFKNKDQIKYYDTKSPYSSMELIMGGNGRASTNVEYSRNINPEWNISGTFSMITAQKQLAPNPSVPRDLMVNSTNYDISLNHRSYNGKYVLLASFSRMGHNVNEPGGIIADNMDEYFKYENASVMLNNAKVRDLQRNFHLYQQFQLTKLLGVYHSIDLDLQTVSFTDDEGGFAADKDHLPPALVDPTQTLDTARFNFLTNEVGLKGNAADLFYNFYVKNRKVKYFMDYLGKITDENENYAGGNIRYDFSKITNLGVSAEYMLGGYYRASASIHHKWLDAEYTRSRYRPALMTQRYFGNHYEWDNDFEGIESDELKGSVTLALPWLVFRPNLSISNVNNYVYFNKEQMPEQTTNAAQILSPSVDLNFVFAKKIHFNNNLTYATVTGKEADVFRVPELLANSQLYYQTPIFQNNLLFQFGVDVRYQSAYYAPAYDPVTQQFYLQDDFRIDDFVTADVFLNFRIGRANLFLKYGNLPQVFGDGYFASPYITGPKAALDFGVVWQFFD